MKSIKFILTIVATSVSVSTHAQVVVSLHSSGTVQHFLGFNALINAYTASNTGDTIYLPGGAFAPVNCNKGLTIYGAGHYPDSTQATGKTFIDGTLTLSGNADNFHIEGVEITGSFNLSNDSINQVTVKFCKINSSFDVQGNMVTPSNNLAFISNVVLGDVILANATNAGIYNSIIQGHIINSTGNSMYNNILLYPASPYDPLMPGVFNNNSMYNNIILQTGWNAVTGGSGNTFKNNLFVLSSPDLGTAVVSQNNYFGVTQSSIFTSQTGNAFNYSHNYHLQSPATYLGTDGSAIGIFGGIFPYKEGAVPSNPHIYLKNISPITTSDGKLNVNINVAAQNN